MESTVDNVFGVMLIAVVLSAVLYGAGFVQFWMYIRRYHSTDPSAIKYLVIAVLVCDTCQQGLITHLIYRTLVSSIANPSILKSAVRFFCWRIYKGGKSVILPAAVSFVSWAVLVLLFFTAAKYGSASLLANPSLQVLAIVTNTLSAGVDVAISVTLMYLLQSCKTEFTKATTDLINRLVRDVILIITEIDLVANLKIIFTFTTGLPTTVFALLSAICIGAFPKTQL
ncbi:hypothetical protein C8R44DRAFT_888430 [Mycena epipterygia]|nr:hypothetical protein C8R44DRAFT_888430 [Mycena epipterygia]